MTNDFYHSDNSQITNIINNTHSRITHIISAHAENISIRIFSFNFRGNSGGVHIPGSFSGRHHNFHKCSCSTDRIAIPAQSASFSTDVFSTNKVRYASMASTLHPVSIIECKVSNPTAGTSKRRS